MDATFIFNKATTQLEQCIDSIEVLVDGMFEGTENLESALFNIASIYSGMELSYLGGTLFIADSSGKQCCNKAWA